jgi:hypothetical protein
MFAGERKNRDDDGTTLAYVHPSEFYTKAHGHGAFPVTVTEVEEDETHYGLIYPLTDRFRDTGEPQFIYERMTLVEVCLPYGLDAEIKHSGCRVAKLRVERS